MKPPEIPGDDPTQLSPYSPYGTPAPLAVAAGLCLIQGLLVLGYGVTELIRVDGDRVALGIAGGAFFVLYGLVLMWCGRGLHQVKAWARGPVLMAQLIWVGIAWNLREADTRAVAIGIVVLAALCLAGVLHPNSIAALERDRLRDEDDDEVD